MGRSYNSEYLLHCFIFLQAQDFAFQFWAADKRIWQFFMMKTEWSILLSHTLLGSSSTSAICTNMKSLITLPLFCLWEIHKFGTCWYGLPINEEHGYWQRKHEFNKTISHLRTEAFWKNLEHLGMQHHNANYV